MICTFFRNFKDVPDIISANILSVTCLSCSLVKDEADKLLTEIKHTQNNSVTCVWNMGAMITTQADVLHRNSEHFLNSLCSGVDAQRTLELPLQCEISSKIMKHRDRSLFFQVGVPSAFSQVSQKALPSQNQKLSSK